MTTSGHVVEPDVGRAWIQPGQRAFRAAAAAAIAGSAAVIVQWIGIGSLLEAVFRSGLDVSEPLLLVAGALVATTGARAAERAATDRGRRRIAHALRLEVLDRLLPAGARPAAAPGTAESAAILISSVDAVADHAAASGPLHRSLPVSMGLTLVAVAVLCWPVAVLLVLATALMPLNLRIAGLVAIEDADRQRIAQNRLDFVLLDALRGAAILRTYGAGALFRQRLDVAGRELDGQTGRLLQKVFLSALVLDVVITFAVAVAATFVGFVLLGYLSFPWLPRMTLGQGFAVLTLCPVYFLPVRRLGAAYHDRDRARSAESAITRLSPARPSSPVPHLGRAPALQLDQVAISVPERRLLVRETTLTVPAERWTGVTGPSGSGKTTLLSVLSGLQAPASGAVVWTVAEDVIHPRPGMAAWVGQHTTPVEGSLADNLRLARPDATDEDLLSVLDLVGLDETVQRMPDGVRTRLGPAHWRLSAGEGRRLAIGRAALRRSRIWVLDEPTAHLDERAGESVVEALLSVTAGCTVVVVTHDDRVLERCETVLHLEDGCLTTVPSGLAAP